MGDKSVKNRTWSGAKGLSEEAKKSLEKITEVRTKLKKNMTEKDKSILGKKNYNSN